jgi:hypothetical protein
LALKASQLSVDQGTTEALLLYEIAKKRDLPGRSKMGRDELAKALGQS